MENANQEEECRTIWTALGPWWDKSVGDEGDAFHRAFLYPSIEKLLELQGGETVLDAGCGNGALSRRIRASGATVLGVDFSCTLLDEARRRNPDITFEEMSLTDSGQLKNLSSRHTFDRIVCSMVLHDMSTLTPFYKSLKLLLNPGGSFIFTIPHPCFNSAFTKFEPHNGVT
ncbi:MAG TPA: methyltransferase domain-containing protein, partial [Chlamydiales bacterium]|nr:methyltransferase domain-containing protein [Chlamydiales bacterium]